LGGVALDHGRLQSAWGEGELPSLGLPVTTPEQRTACSTPPRTRR
jgi:hypothetical protein